METVKSADLFTGSQVKLLQFTPTGVPQPSTAEFDLNGTPSVRPFNLVQSYLAGDGFISLSGDKKFIAVPGYNDAAGTPFITFSKTNSTSAKGGRTVGKAFADDTLRTKGTFNALSGGNFGSAVCKDKNYYLGGAKGIAYTYRDTSDGIGPTISLSSNGVNVLNIFDKTLLASVNCEGGLQHGIWQVGENKDLPTSGTPTFVSIINTGSGSSPYAFAFSPSGTTCYVADDRPFLFGNCGGVQKWVYSGTYSKTEGWSGGTWSLAYTLGTGSSVGARGLTVDFSGANAIIYATTAELLHNRLISITDAGASSVAVTLSTAGTLYAYKGVAFAPKPKTTGSSTITVTTLSPNSVTTVYGNASSNMVFNVSGSDLTDGITITPPAGFEVSLSSGSGFGNSVVVGSSGTVASTPVYVRLKSTDAVGNYSGSIACTSDDATTQYVVIANSTVTPAALTITASDEYKCPNFALILSGTAFTSSGLVNGDAVNSVTLTSSGAAASAPIGTYPIVPSAAVGTGLSNYSITYVNGTLTVSLEGGLGITLTQVNPDCGGITGSLTSTVTGGTAPYTYSLLNAQTLIVTSQSNPLFSPLVAGGYSYSVVDAEGCKVTALPVGLKPLTKTPLMVTSQGTAQVCYGGSLTLTTNVLGGNGPFEYSLNGGPFVPSSARYFNVTAAAGMYYITVEDANSCNFNTDTITVTQPSAPVTFTTVETVGCTGTGTITVSALGGYGSYTYSDDGGSSYQPDSVFVAPYGTYSIAVQDEMGCNQLLTETVHIVALTSSDIIGNTTVCPSGDIGATTTLNVVPTGGTPPYTYSLNGGSFVDSSQRYFNVGAGTYTITVMDAAGCTFTPSPVTVTTIDCSGPATSGNGGNHHTNNISSTGVSQVNEPQVSEKVVSTIKVFEAHLSPNPSPSAFHLQLQGSNNENVEVTVTNIVGVKVYESRGSVNGAFDFGADFKNGMYILQIRQGNTVHTVKLIKGN